MNIKTLEVRLHNALIGYLFRYGEGSPLETIRFVPSEEYIADVNRKTLSSAFNQGDDELTRQTLSSITAPEFNGRPDPSHSGAFLLPAWFQNLLPEGAFRAHIAQIRNCAESNHFELLAACGKDLPGAVSVVPAHLTHSQVQRLVTQDQDALEMSVVEIPMVEGISISGVQPKIGVNEVDGRYVARAKLEDATRVIAKLPAVGYPRMPELEHLSMELARAAGVNACVTKLLPLSALVAEHGYDLGEEGGSNNRFLAVPRYDRTAGGARVHAEDLAQLFGLMPGDKYALHIDQPAPGGKLMRTEMSYCLIMKFFLGVPSLGEDAVFELLRRIVVNELLGNSDCHLKNIGLYYPDGVTPQLPPAYDMVALHVYNNSVGHGLMLGGKAEVDQLRAQQQASPKFSKVSSNVAMAVSPYAMRMFSQATGIAEKRLSAVAREVVKLAEAKWPDMIETSYVTDEQKRRMLKRLQEHPAISKKVGSRT